MPLPAVSVSPSSPAGVGNANNGSNLGVSVLNSNNVVSNSNPNYGGALTSSRELQRYLGKSCNPITMCAPFVGSYGRWTEKTALIDGIVPYRIRMGQ